MRTKYIYKRAKRGVRSENVPDMITRSITNKLSKKYKYLCVINLVELNIVNGYLIIDYNWLLEKVKMLFSSAKFNVEFDKELILICLVIGEDYYINCSLFTEELFCFSEELFSGDNKKKLSINDFVIKQIIE